MMRWVVTILLLWMYPVLAGAPGTVSGLIRTSADEWNNSFNESNIRFQENRGQFVDTEGSQLDDVRFFAYAAGVRMYIRDHGISYVFSQMTSESCSNAQEKHSPAYLCFMEDSDLPMREECRLDMILEGSNPDVRIRAMKPFDGHLNYYLPHCAEGITGVREYAFVVYENVYPHIDFELFSVNGRIKYNFVVRPGGDARRIAMRYTGATDAVVSHAGTLSVSAPIGRIEEAAPYTYADDENNVVASRFVVQGNTVSFQVGEYDPSATLVIDPWATYFGSTGQEYCEDVATDAQGNAYLVGYSAGGTLPVTIGSSNPGSYTAFIARLSSTGQRLWATYYGGSQSDAGSGICVDGSGHVNIAGHTSSTDFPVTAGAFQTSHAGVADAFIVQLNTVDGTCAWATFFGGNGNDAGGNFSKVEIVSDSNDNIIVTGNTTSTNLPVTAGAFQTSKAGSTKTGDIFLVKMTSTGTRIWATYYGGRSADGSANVHVDAQGNIILVGSTQSRDFPTTAGAFQTAYDAKNDGCIVKFDATGARLWATYCSGSNQDFLSGVVSDEMGDLYISGMTLSGNFPVTPGAFQTSKPGGFDPVVMKFSANGTRIWSTFCGGSEYQEFAREIVVDASGRPVIVGYTPSTDYPLLNAFQPFPGNQPNSAYEDAFVTKLSADGTGLVWSTLYGGSKSEIGMAVSMDASGNVFLAGRTTSSDLPVYNAWQGSLAGTGGASDAFLVQFDANGQIPGYNFLPTAVAAATPEQGAAPLTVQCSSAGSMDRDGSITAYLWDFGDNSTSPLEDPVHTFSAEGVYNVVLTVTDNDNGTASDTVTVIAQGPSLSVRVAEQTVTRIYVNQNRAFGRDLIRIHDNYDAPVAGVQVTATYTGPNSGTVSGSTNLYGWIAFETAVKSKPSGVWCFTVTDVQASGYTFDAVNSVLTACESVPRRNRASPVGPALAVLPHPVRGNAELVCTLPSEGMLHMVLYDILGREVQRFTPTYRTAGSHRIPLDGSRFFPGLYYAKLEWNGDTVIKAITILR